MYAVTEARAQLSDLVHRAKNGEAVLIGSHRQPEAVLVAVDEQPGRARDDRLLREVLGLLDGVPHSRVAALRRRGITTASTTFSARDVYRLLDAVEAVRPGLLDHYAALRAAQEED